LHHSHGLAGSANADFSVVIASQGEMADAMDFSVEGAELPQQAHIMMTLIDWGLGTNCRSG
jgi:uncharacterized protein YcbK (DUF882 family)